LTSSGEGFASDSDSTDWGRNTASDSLDEDIGFVSIPLAGGSASDVASSDGGDDSIPLAGGSASDVASSDGGDDSIPSAGGSAPGVASSDRGDDSIPSTGGSASDVASSDGGDDSIPSAGGSGFRTGPPSECVDLHRTGRRNRLGILLKNCHKSSQNGMSLIYSMTVSSKC